ncbi:MAG: hypothetical protein Q8M65_00665, partial [Rhodoglobus sp.]|nr:hypothetical protein [Rhodoglobus sp.]
EGKETSVSTSFLIRPLWIMLMPLEGFPYRFKLPRKRVAVIVLELDEPPYPKSSQCARHTIVNTCSTPS